MTKVAVLDYGIGNLGSAQKALVHVGADARLTSDPGEIDAADAVVLPGVGAFGACIDALAARGLDQVSLQVAADGRPFLGICVGMQMMCAGSQESPTHRGLGIFDVEIRRLPAGVKHPQMQWNVLVPTRDDHPMLRDLRRDGHEPWVYFVHSYAAADSDDTVAVCDYGGRCVAALAHGSVWATQFHPEKSGSTGLAILANFVRWATR